MIDNTTKKTININDDNASAISKDKSSKPANLIKDLSSINKDNDIPWFKKKGSIIGISATLGAGALATIIAVPIALTSSDQIRKVGEIRKVVNFYDSTKKTAKLVVTGSELPQDKSLYEVSRITSSRAIIPVNPNDIELVQINKEEIHLNLSPDEKFNSVYQVKLNNGSLNGSVVQSSESVAKRKIEITTQPQNHTIPVSSTETSASLTVVANIIDHTGQPIAGIEPTYQWKMANDNSLIESDWYTIPNATQSIYTYDVSGLVANEKKYFKCVISDKYADSSTTEAAFVTKVDNPTIAITNQSSSIDLQFDATSTTLSVTASVVNATDSRTLTYKWQESNTATGTFTDISGANSSTYTYDVSSVQTGSKKYFKCIVSSANIASVESRVIYVGKNSPPKLSFTKEIGDIIVPMGTNNVTLSVEVGIDIPIPGQTLSYKWYESDTNSVDSTWSVIANATSSSVSVGLRNLTKPDVKKFFKCEVTYNNGNKITSNVGSVGKSNPIVTFTKAIGDVTISSTAANTNVTLSVDVSVAYPHHANAQFKYQWYELSSRNDLNGTIISGATSKTYTYDANQNNLQAGNTKYFKCEAIFGEIYKAHSIGSITKRGPSITISKNLNSITGFTPSSPNPILSIEAAIINDGSNSRPLSYQWEKSTTNPATNKAASWTTIQGATNSSYTVEIPNTSNWTDTWYRCKVTSNVETISAVYSRDTCVKMQLTNGQAKADLIKWFSDDANATKVLKQFFTTNIEKDNSGEFYRYLYDYEFNTTDQFQFPKTEFHSANPKTITVENAKPFKSYTIVLRTISDGQYRLKSRQNNGVWTTLLTGSYIQFDLLFSFTGNAELVRENGTSKYTINFNPTFRSIGGNNFTILGFDYNASQAGNVKKSAYTVKVYARDGSANNPLFTDSLLQSITPSGMSSTEYKDIPTYNGVTGRK